MADAFKYREKGFEAKYKLDQEHMFKAESRRNRLVGKWAADKLGLSGGAVDDYVRAVVRADFDEPGVDDVVRKIKADFDGAKIAVGEADIRAELDRQMVVAAEQISKELS
jgi:hypothetical protein